MSLAVALGLGDRDLVRLAPGAYIVRLEARGLRETRTLRLVR